jgi:hypothetical protein
MAESSLKETRTQRNSMKLSFVRKPFARNPALGTYGGTKEEWSKAYRYARIAQREGVELSAKFTGLRWKAGIVVNHHRNCPDLILNTPIQNLICSKLIDEILSEENVE